MNRPHGLDDLTGAAAASRVPTILLPVPFMRDLTAYIADLERRHDLLDALAALVLDRTPVGTPTSHTGRLRERVEGLLGERDEPVLDWSAAVAADRGRRGYA